MLAERKVERERPSIEKKGCKGTLGKAVILSRPALEESNHNLRDPTNKFVKPRLHCDSKCAGLLSESICEADKEDIKSLFCCRRLAVRTAKCKIQCSYVVCVVRRCMCRRIRVTAALCMQSDNLLFWFVLCMQVACMIRPRNSPEKNGLKVFGQFVRSTTCNCL